MSYDAKSSAVDDSMSLKDLKSHAASLGIAGPVGHKGHKASWIAAIRRTGSPRQTRRNKPSAAAITACMRVIEQTDAGWGIVRAITALVVPCREIEEHLAEASRLIDASSPVDSDASLVGSLAEYGVPQWRDCARALVKAELAVGAAAVLAEPMLKLPASASSSHFKVGGNTLAWGRAYLRARMKAISEATGCGAGGE